MRSIASIVFVFSVIFYVSGQEKFPSDIQRCKAGDVACISRTTTDLIQKYPKGRPELGFPSIDPFKVPHLSVRNAQGARNQNINLSIDLNNINVQGLSKTVIEKMVGFTKDPNTSKFEVYVRVPSLKLDGDYKSDGRILSASTKGEGKFNLLVENVKVGVKFKPKVTQKNGKNFLSVDKIKVKVDKPESLKIKLDVLKGDAMPLGQNINDYLNENWQIVWDAIYPSIRNTFLDISQGLIDRTLARFAYDDIYLPS